MPSYKLIILNIWVRNYDNVQISTTLPYIPTMAIRNWVMGTLFNNSYSRPTFKILYSNKLQCDHRYFLPFALCLIQKK